MKISKDDTVSRLRRADDDRALSVRELSQRYGLGVSTLREKIASGVGPPVFRPPGGNRVRVWRSDADAWFESNSKPEAV
jgi:hypothetical protein